MVAIEICIAYTYNIDKKRATDERFAPRLDIKYPSKGKVGRVFYVFVKLSLNRVNQGGECNNKK